MSQQQSHPARKVRIPARVLVGAVAALGLAGAAGMVAGYVAAKRAIPYYVRIGMVEPAVRAIRTSLRMPEAIRWTQVRTEEGAVETAAIPITPAGQADPAAVEDIGGNLLVMTMDGALFYLTPSRELRSLEVAAPMNRQALEARVPPSRRTTKHVRAHDLLAVPASEGAFDVYASYDHFRDEGCFDLAVSRIRIQATESGLEPQSEWRQVFAAEPCWGVDSRYLGLQAGGRMALMGDDTLLLSLGDATMDGSEGRPDTPQDPRSDFGKLVAISLSRGSATHFAAGFRNPQGLLVDSARRIWSSEHGPRGGDEINLVRNGANYGWPLVTYGLPYREPRSEHTSFGGHDGYARPVQVFTPSIGPSQLIEPSVERFPFWRSCFLLATLRNESIYVLRIDGDDVVSAEPVFLDARLRDMISRPNGDIAMVTEERGGGGLLILMRPRAEGGEQSFVVRDLRTHRTTQTVASGEEAGRRIFEQSCSSCHSVTGEDAVGPPLDGVVGRDIAGVAGVAYSDALSEAPGQWTPERLRAFLTNPQAGFAGTTMPAPGLNRRQADDVIAYLRSTD